MRLPWQALPQNHSAVLGACLSLFAKHGEDAGKRVTRWGAHGPELLTLVCAGTEKGMAETFGSTCHGAGRASSRNSARRKLDYQTVRRLAQLLLCNVPFILTDVWRFLALCL